MRAEVRSRFASIGATLAGVVATLFGAYVLTVQLGGAIVTVAAHGIVAFPRGIIWLTLALQRGTSGWVIAGRILAATVGALRVPLVTMTVISLELMAVGALFALRTLLRTTTGPPDAEDMHT